MSESITHTTTLIINEDVFSNTSPSKTETECNQCEIEIENTTTEETETKVPNVLTILKNTMIPLTVSNVDLNSVDKDDSQSKSIKIINSNLFLDRIRNNELKLKRESSLSDNNNLEIYFEVEQVDQRKTEA